MRAGIIGYGEIGSALASLFRVHHEGEPEITDPALHMNGRLAQCDVLHVCVPAHAVPKVVVRLPRNPLYIVHSTVPVGTCRTLYERGARVIHAPVRGIHPNLAKSLETFVMPLGGPQDDGAGRPSLDHVEAADRLQRIGIQTEIWGPWEDTELAKLLCTTRLGIDVLWMRHVQELCVKHGADFDRVYMRWTHEYNHGFAKLDPRALSRPVLDPWPGPIGGHCVMPNARMLAPDSAWARQVAEEGAKDWQPGTPARTT